MEDGDGGDNNGEYEAGDNGPAFKKIKKSKLGMVDVLVRIL